FGDQLLDALDVGDLLALQVPPQLLQLGLAVGVGDVLVVAPQGVEPLAQILDQVVVVVGAAAAFADVLHLFFRCQCHDGSPVGGEGNSIAVVEPLHGRTSGARSARSFCLAEYSRLITVSVEMPSASAISR